MAKSEVNVTAGSSPLFLLFLVFLVLKLTGVIAWSWWWVTAPIWIPVGLVLIVVAFCLLMLGVLTLLDAATKRRKRKARN